MGGPSVHAVINVIPMRITEAIPFKGIRIYVGLALVVTKYA